MRRRVVAIVAAVVAGLLVLLSFHAPRAGPDAADPMGSERASDGAPPAILEAPESAGHAGRRIVSTSSDRDGTEAAPGEVVLPPEMRASLRLDMVDAATGVPVSATWNVQSSNDEALQKSAAWLRRQPASATRDDWLRRHVEAWEAEFLPSGAVRPDVLVHQVNWDWGVEVASPPMLPPHGSLTVRPPPGYCAPGPLDGMPYGLQELSQLLAAGVREAVAVVPLHREALLHLRVLGPDDRPAVGAVVRSVAVAGRRRGAVEDLGPGEFRVVGIPHLPGEPVAIAIDWIVEGAVASHAIEPGPPTETEEVRGTGPPTETEEVRGIQDVDAPDATSVVPADLSRPWSLVVRLTGPTGLRILDHNETDNDLPTEASLGVAGDGPTGTARVTVLGWDGRPVAGATVSGRVTDADGVVVVSGLPAGQLEFSTRPDGRYPARATAVVPEGAEVDVVLREPVGAVLDVLVTDEEGNPRPSALLWASVVVFDVVDGVQRLDRFTDARGRRTFARVEPGEVTVHASWGSRHGNATVTLRDGERASLHIVAK
jgi:hypothetical protein